tara:strand:+ start:96 stop:302 length:207 start_codon:yes stop_codon:yes gene_type:complete
MKTIEIEVGRLLCGKVRDFLNNCKFKGMNIEFNESSGFIERDFTIRGADNDIALVKSSLDNWVNSLDT